VFGRFSAVSAVDVNELERALNEGATVIDVREPHEFAAGHVPGARLLPLGEVSHRLSELKGSTDIHVICATGNRSETAVRLLAKRGVGAVNVAGGTGAWRRAGKPVERGL
jgi:rhodanese-related sulfurtransferase